MSLFNPKWSCKGISNWVLNYGTHFLIITESFVSQMLTVAALFIEKYLQVLEAAAFKI
jgi:hypothetical protein